MRFGELKAGDMMASSKTSEFFTVLEVGSATWGGTEGVRLTVLTGRGEMQKLSLWAREPMGVHWKLMARKEG